MYYASLLELIGGSGKVLGIEIDGSENNVAEIQKHPMFHRIHVIEGSSTAAETVAKMERVAREHSTIMVCLDLNYTHLTGNPGFVDTRSDDESLLTVAPRGFLKEVR